MAAAKLDILIEQGTTFKKTLRFKDNNGVLQDLTGFSFSGQVRKTAGDPNLLATFVCTILNQVTNKGEVEITISASDTALIPVSKSKTNEKVNAKYCYDIERLKPDSITKERIIEGTAEVSPEVTLA